LLANLAVSGFNPRHHRLPVPASFSDTHAAEYSEGARREARGVEVMILCHYRSPPTHLDCLTASRPFVTLRADSADCGTTLSAHQNSVGPQRLRERENNA
jgi:hypothetical protein